MKVNITPKNAIFLSQNDCKNIIKNKTCLYMLINNQQTKFTSKYSSVGIRNKRSSPNDLYNS